MKPLLMSVNMQAGNLGVDTFQIAGEEVQVHNVEIRKNVYSLHCGVQIIGSEQVTIYLSSTLVPIASQALHQKHASHPTDILFISYLSIFLLQINRFPTILFSKNRHQ